MSLTRKDFFRQALFSLGKTALDVSGALQGTAAAAPQAALETTPPPEPSLDLVAEAFNERCLARNCGCFACAERCEPQAIMVAPGEGVRINAALCNGCGMCEYVCPVTPKAVAMVPREQK